MTLFKLILYLKLLIEILPILVKKFKNGLDKSQIYFLLYLLIIIIEILKVIDFIKVCHYHIRTNAKHITIKMVVNKLANLHSLVSNASYNSFKFPLQSESQASMQGY